MNEHSTSRPATPEERVRIHDFLFREYLKTEYGNDHEKAVWTGQETDDDLAIEADLAYVSNIMDESDVHTYHNFFPDGDLIEVRIWPINFLNTFQQFKQLADGTLERYQPSRKQTNRHVWPAVG